ncbi:MAG: nuclear transport factor 2 family protein [Thermoplasmata archaeon]|nr:nuclear transport factor 2 family protein [Candidatus Sysuiplasma acidicola]
MDEYSRRTNLHRFEEVAPLIDNKALYWFSDGSTHEGIDAIRAVFERNWKAITNEVYRIEDLRWIAQDESLAVCVYTFHWDGETREGHRSGEGRGSCVLQKVNGYWRVIHEHLSRTAP